MATYHVKTNKKNREQTLRELHSLGAVAEMWPDGSYNFKPYDPECEDEVVEWCEDHGIETELL